jgi:thiol-disulfide isomerase/thioredoxin
MMHTPILATLLSLFMLITAPALAGFELKPWTGGATPPLSLLDVAGKKVDLAQYRGKVVLVNFWATWCAPCVAELPAMQKLRDKLSLSGFEVLAVNYKDSQKKIDDFLVKRPLALPIPRDSDGAVGMAWSVRTFPTSFVIDADGRIRYWVIGEVDWLSPSVESRIRELLPKT